MTTPFPRPRKSAGNSLAPHERRAVGAYPYFKLAVWDKRNQCFRDGKNVHESEAAALAAAKSPGRYRISVVGETGKRMDGDWFEIQ